MHPALRETRHRPWPFPTDRWRWRQSWLDLAFIHYRADAAEFEARYSPVSEPLFPATGTFEHWMAERYCLYAGDGAGGRRRVEVHDTRWPVQRAEVTVVTNDVLSVAGIETHHGSQVCHFSSRVDVVSYPAKAVGSPEDGEMLEAKVGP